MPPLADLSGQHILIVDDVRFTRLTLTKMLQQFGTPRLSEAAGGAEALQRLQAGSPPIDVVITDLQMPDVDGLAVLAAIRRGDTAAPPSLPVILLSGHTELERLGAAIALDLDSFLTKPVSLESLDLSLQRLARRRDPTPAPVPLAVSEDPRQEETAIELAVAPAGVILARDLLFPNGRLICASGTCLSERQLDILRDLLPLTGTPTRLWIEGTAPVI